MDENKGKNYRPRKRRSNLSYFLVGLVGAILGGFVTAYVAPNYLYGKVMKTPDVFMVNNSDDGNSQSVEISPREDVSNVTAVAEKTMVSVVGITTIQIQREFFWEREVPGVGSGVIIDSDGYILTNAHVVGDESVKSLDVLFEDGDMQPGTVLWKDPALDIAIVKVDKTGLPAVEYGSSEGLRIGELAVAIGNPLGLDFQRTVTSGIISGLNRSIRIDQYTVMEDLIQTDASINPGNSGGPLLNYKGELIGINTAKVKAGEGLGFAIPVDIIIPIATQIIEKGGFQDIYLGFKAIELEQYERQTGIKTGVDSGLVVLEVMPNSPAHISNLRELDIVTEVDGVKIQSRSQLKKLLYNYKLGDRVEVKYVRDGVEEKVQMTFVEF